MTIKEQLVVIKNTLEKLRNDFEILESEKEKLDQEYVVIFSNFKNEIQANRADLLSLKEEVLKYYRIAEENSYRIFSSDGKNVIKPDLGKLNAMVEQIDINKRDDYIAGQIIELAEHYVAYIDNEISKLSSIELRKIVAATNEKERDKRVLLNKQKQVFVTCERYLQGPDLINLFSLLEIVQKSYEIVGEYFQKWDSHKNKNEMMMIGYYSYHIDVPKILGSRMKESLKHHFDEINKSVNSPFGYTMNNHKEIFVEYLDNNLKELKSGIQALILNYLRYLNPSEFKISVIDYIHFNADILGPVSILASIKNGIIDGIATDARTYKQNISILVNYYRKVEGRIGYESVYLYNKNHQPSERIPLRIIIINRKEESFKQAEDSDMLYILNNAEKFGITIIYMTKSCDGGSKGKSRENKYHSNTKNIIRIISDNYGNFYISIDDKWVGFKWLVAPISLPSIFVNKVADAVKPCVIGTKYSSRYPMSLPNRSIGKRKPIIVPFAVDDDDQVKSCCFENELFAAYLMGATRSGKSTLLHTIISGILRNYHPDEVELWLLDFKMLEFKRYVNHRPPHVKYLLLEKSRDLVFDIVDQMTKELASREYIFSQNGWSKLTEVSPDIYMPVIFVIIDEFAQMSQILKETKGNGYSSDYTIKLENMLAKGAALGFKFIFASQTYTTGISGLTETACKQIQMRFALKNTPDEIKQTLTLSSDEISQELSRSISSLPAHETLFKWRNNNGEVNVGRFKNMFIESDEIDTLIDYINNNMIASINKSVENERYMEKNPVLIDGSQPKTFISQVPFYKKNYADMNKDDLDPDDILIYPGVPSSFNVSKPFKLGNGTSENMLLAGGGRESSASIILSIINSYKRQNKSIEIWSHEKNSSFKKFKNTIFSEIRKYYDLDELCNQIVGIKKDILGKTCKEKLVICFGYEKLCSDFEILGTDNASKTRKEFKTRNRDSQVQDMSEILKKVKECTSSQEKQRIIDTYNKQRDTIKTQLDDEKEDDDVLVGLYDARADFEWILKRASNYGIHFLMCFEQARDFVNVKLEEKTFKHKILFSMSKDESLTILGNRRANEIDENSFIYTNGIEIFAMRPHIYKGVICNGWIINDNGQIEQGR